MPKNSSKSILHSSRKKLTKAQFLYEARYFPERTAEMLKTGNYNVPESVYQSLNYVQVFFVTTFARIYKLPTVFDGIKHFSGDVPDALGN